MLDRGPGNPPPPEKFFDLVYAKKLLKKKSVKLRNASYLNWLVFKILEHVAHEASGL